MLAKLMLIFPLMTFALSAAEPAQDLIRFKGADTLGAKLVPELGGVYKTKHGGAKFEVAGEGSDTAFKALLDGTADIGMSSREIKQEEAELFEERKIQLHKHLAAYDCLVILVHANNPVNNLTAKQIEGLFTGDITNWRDVGGMDAPVLLRTRNTASGSYKEFSRIAMNGRPYAKGSIKLQGSETPVQGLVRDVNAITYAGLSYAKAQGIKTISINGIAPPLDRANDYPYIRPCYYFIRSDASPATKAFMEWATQSAEAKAIVRKIGFLAAKS
ncbi:phosphate ABC transporter substrate-binding protein [Luteolibacter yonseiensis]